MEVLPPEINYRLLSELAASDLANCCVTNRKVALFCADRYFWRQKVVSLARRQLQEEWLIGLALLDERRLLSYLIDAIEQVEKDDPSTAPLIDDRAIVIAYMALYWVNSNIKLLERLDRRLSCDFRRMLLRGSKDLRDFAATNTLWVRSKLQTLDQRRWEVDLGPAHVTTMTYEFYQLKAANIIASLPSPSHFLTLALNCPSQDIANNLSAVITELLLPHLIRSEEGDVIKVFLRDVEALKADLAAKKITRLRPGYLRGFTINRLVLHGDYDFVDRILNGDWREVGDIVDNTVKCEDARVYRRVVQIFNYRPTYLIGSYRSMEPKECVGWFEKLPPTVNREEAIQTVVGGALCAGYSHFVSVVGRYGRDKGYIKTS